MLRNVVGRIADRVLTGWRQRTEDFVSSEWVEFEWEVYRAGAAQ